MLDNGYFTLSFEGMLGLFVTVFSVWLVIRQLREAKVASQMEGILALGDRFDGIVEHNDRLFELAKSQRWKEADNEKAFEINYESKKNREAFFKVASFYETLAVLVRRKVLNQRLAFDGWGDMVAIRWQWMEKAVLAQRVATGNEKYWQHWEWLAQKFESYEG